jgi:hypothetical protein
MSGRPGEGAIDPPIKMAIIYWASGSTIGWGAHGMPTGIPARTSRPCR